jgi:hypothetical protein
VNNGSVRSHDRESQERWRLRMEDLGQPREEASVGVHREPNRSSGRTGRLARVLWWRRYMLLRDRRKADPAHAER